MTVSAGPPVRLLTGQERRRRRRVITILVIALSTFAITLTFAAVHIATRPNSEVHLGSNTFRVGGAQTLARRIKADDYPLLFQDLRNNSIDIFVNHDRGRPFYKAWRAVEAHAPGAPRTCTLKWTGSGYSDPCSGKTFPANGKGLRRFQVKVVKGVLYVNFRQTI